MHKMNYYIKQLNFKAVDVNDYENMKLLSDDKMNFIGFSKQAISNSKPSSLMKDNVKLFDVVRMIDPDTGEQTSNAFVDELDGPPIIQWCFMTESLITNLFERNESFTINGSVYETVDLIKDFGGNVYANYFIKEGDNDLYQNISHDLTNSDDSPLDNTDDNLNRTEDIIVVVSQTGDYDCKYSEILSHRYPLQAEIAEVICWSIDQLNLDNGVYAIDGEMETIYWEMMGDYTTSFNATNIEDIYKPRYIEHDNPNEYRMIIMNDTHNSDIFTLALCRRGRNLDFDIYDAVCDLRLKEYGIYDLTFTIENGDIIYQNIHYVGNMIKYDGKLV